MTVQFPLACLMAVLAFTAGVIDLLSRRIPNWLVLAGLLLAFSIQAYLNGWMGVKSALLGAGLALLIHLPLFALHATGGGDVKLMVALGAILGPSNWLILFVITALLGGIAAIAVLLSRGGLARALDNIGHILYEAVRFRAPHRSKPELAIESKEAVTLPRGAVIAVGAAVYLVLAASQ